MAGIAASGGSGTVVLLQALYNGADLGLRERKGDELWLSVQAESDLDKDTHLIRHCADGSR